MGPRAGLDGCGKFCPPTGVRSPDRPARSESLYRLSYPGPAESPLQIQIRLRAVHRCHILRVLAQVIVALPCNLSQSGAGEHIVCCSLNTKAYCQRPRHYCREIMVTPLEIVRWELIICISCGHCTTRVWRLSSKAADVCRKCRYFGITRSGQSP